MKETEEQEQEHISSAAGILVFHIFLEEKKSGFLWVFDGFYVF